jgi:hypothetical protein
MSTPLSVDILFNAVDTSRNATMSFMKQIESVDSAMQNLSRKTGGESAASGGGDTASRIFAGLTNRMLIVEGLQVGMNLANIAMRMHQYEATKATAPLGEVLKKHQEIHDAARGLIRDLPFIGQTAARVMDVFGNSDGLKRVADLVERVHQSTAATMESLRSGIFDIRRMEAENAGAAGSELSGITAEEAQQKRRDEIAAKKKAVEDGKQAVAEKRKQEDADALAGYKAQGLEEYGSYRPKEAFLDRTESERIQKEIVDPAEKALREKEMDDARRRGIEAARIEKQKELETQNERDRQQKLLKEKDTWETQQARRIEELKARQIEDREQRERELINIRYKYEMQQARESGMNADLLEQQRQMELAGVKSGSPAIRPGRLSAGRTPAQEMRFLSGGGGFGPGMDYAAQTAKNTLSLVGFMAKMVRQQEQFFYKFNTQQGDRSVSNYG